MKTNIDIDELIENVLNNIATSREQKIFEEWIKEQRHLEYFQICKQIWNSTSGIKLSAAEIEKANLKIKKYIHDPGKYNRRSMLKKYFIRYSVASVIIIVATLSIREFFPKILTKDDVYYTNFPADVNKITLERPNGEIILLSNISDTSFYDQEGIKYTKRGNSLVISYHGDRIVAHSKYSTISVPKGEKFKLQTADGTKITINSESSLHYPVLFSGGKRLVTLKGEAYFEVAKDSAAQFIVQTDNMNIKVIGTKFNVSSYDDDTLSFVALLEGKLQVKAYSHEETLTENQTFYADKTTGMIRVARGDTDESAAWKDNKLIVKALTFDKMIKQFERWYGVKIINNAIISDNEKFNGKFDSENIEDAMKIIAASVKVKYRINGDTIIIEPK